MIPSLIYKQIVELMPILCVDVIVRYKDKYVLLKRANEPLKGEWWVIGGRVHKNESTEEAAFRKVFEETGLTATSLAPTGVYEDFYPKSSWGVPTHSVSIVYEATVNNFNYTLDETSSDIKLSKKLPARFLKYYEKR